MPVYRRQTFLETAWSRHMTHFNFLVSWNISSSSNCNNLNVQKVIFVYGLPNYISCDDLAAKVIPLLHSFSSAIFRICGASRSPSASAELVSNSNVRKIRWQTSSAGHDQRTFRPFCWRTDILLSCVNVSKITCIAGFTKVGLRSV